nr:hypothetical protein [Lachnospiraceae bacterium]
MFGTKNQAVIQEKEEKIEELEREIAKLKDDLKVSNDELEAVNTSTHLGIWKCYYDENGDQTVIYTDEFR